MKTYNAPWCLSLVIVTWACTALCLGIAVSCWFGLSSGDQLAFWIGLLLVGLVVGCALFTIRGYTVTADTILVHRLFWDTRLPRAGLQSVQADPKAMRWSLRTFGNGGFFSATGFYWNKSLGAYHAFVTDPRRAVVLKYPARTVVLSPEAPDEFAQELSVPVAA